MPAHSKKGFKGHKVNPTLKPTFRGGVTNHQRHVARRIQREQQAKMRQEVSND